MKVMKHRLKLKIFASFFLLIAMLAVAGTISIIEFRKLSYSVYGMLEDNYKSINAAKDMIEALEREDSGVLLLLHGEWEEGRRILARADSVFNISLQTAKNNLTEENEKDYVKAIEDSYSQYTKQWERPIVETKKQGNINWYKNKIHQSFLDTKKKVEALMTLNQESMYQEVSRLSERSKRALMPGIVAILSALVFAALLNFFISHYFIQPLSDLIKVVNNHKKGMHALPTTVKSNDEIKQLEGAINELIDRIGEQSDTGK
jgi:HAMP domain-containing protein